MMTKHLPDSHDDSFIGKIHFQYFAYIYMHIFSIYFAYILHIFFAFSRLFLRNSGNKLGRRSITLARRICTTLASSELYCTEPVVYCPSSAAASASKEQSLPILKLSSFLLSSFLIRQCSTFAIIVVSKTREWNFEAAFKVFLRINRRA